jgi:SAM-dependent methyltransferase
LWSRGRVSLKPMSSDIEATAALYGEQYYRHDCGLPYERNEHWSRFFGGVADAIVRELHPRSVLDVGCAMGFLVEELRLRGVEAWGIDISEYAIGKVHESVADYCAVWSAAAESLPEGFPQTFDLVTCIEVIEHLPDPDVLPALENLTRYADRLLFSSSPEDYTEATHLNVKSPDDWSARLAGFGMWRNLDLDASFLTPWAVVYDRHVPVPPELVASYERAYVLQRTEIRALRAEAVRRHTEDVLTSSDRSEDERELDAERQLADERARAENALDELATTREQLQTANLNILSVRENVVTAEATAAHLREHVSQLESELIAQRVETNHLNSWIQELQLQAQREALLQSKTWRIGAAFRSPFRLIGRMRKH